MICTNVNFSSLCIATSFSLLKISKRFNYSKIFSLFTSNLFRIVFLFTDFLIIRIDALLYPAIVSPIINTFLVSSPYLKSCGAMFEICDCVYRLLTTWTWLNLTFLFHHYMTEYYSKAKQKECVFWRNRLVSRINGLYL